MLKNRNFMIISLINFAAMIVYFLLFVISGPFAEARFGASASMAGLVAGAMILGCLAGRFCSGKLVAMMGLTRFLLVGIVIFILSIGLYFTVFNLAFLVFVRFLSGIGIGCVGTVAGTIIAYIVPPQKLGVGIAWFSMSTVLAMALGPFLGISLMDEIGFEGLFGVCLGCAVLCLVLSFGLRMAEEPKAKQGGKGFRLDDFVERNTAPIGAVMLVAAMGCASVQAFISFFAREHDLVEPASLFFLVYAVVVLLSRPLTGKAFDVLGENIILYPALALMAAGLFVLSQAETATAMLIAGGLIGGGYGNFQSVLQALAIRSAPPGRYAQSTSTFFIFLDFGIGFGPYFMGQLIASLGYRGLYEVMAVMTLCVMPLYWALYGSRRSRLYLRLRERKRRWRGKADQETGPEAE